MDIAQNAKKVVFCGTFEAKGGEVEIGGGPLAVRRLGSVRKLVARVEQITYSGRQALKRGHEAVIVTERAVFRLVEDGLFLAEVAPGIDIRVDILDRMAFTPLMPRDPVLMDATLFRD